MTQNEFYTLTGVQVENDEFWAINDIDIAWRLLDRWQCRRRARLDVWAELATDHMTASQEQALNRLGIITRVNQPRIMGFVFDDIVDTLHNV